MDGPMFDPEGRYARHLILPEIGPEGQAKLNAASVLVIGAGGLGSPVLLYLAAAGIGRLGLADDDVVSLSNLQRQVLHGTARLGQSKTASARDRLSDLNPEVLIETHAIRIEADTAAALIGGFDLVIDCTDNLAARHLINRACVAAGVPLLSGAIAQWEGQIGLYAPGLGGPCYACTFPEPDHPPPAQSKGVVGALPGVVGARMALEAIKFLTGAGQSLLGRLWMIDTLWNEERLMHTHRRDDCPVCRARGAEC
ncbi:HesA/MoeB/ThiF family protein [Rhodobacter capsulatus]|uniref:HesA/MoeB/ThiF family protein n=1 Tax=Rhodobacter capsulatus TaxID=1061 RepID=UPI00402979F3